jgi:hypothetical protein
MQQDAGVPGDLDLRGTLRFSDVEGGFWSLELDEPHDELGDRVVLQGFAPTPPLGDGSHVRVRARESEAQFGFIMSGPMVDVVDLTALG